MLLCLFLWCSLTSTAAFRKPETLVGHQSAPPCVGGDSSCVRGAPAALLVGSDSDHIWPRRTSCLVPLHRSRVLRALWVAGLRTEMNSPPPGLGATSVSLSPTRWPRRASCLVPPHRSRALRALWVAGLRTEMNSPPLGLGATSVSLSPVPYGLPDILLGSSCCWIPVVAPAAVP